MNVVATTQQVGAFIIDTTEQWGRSWIFLYRTVLALFKPPYRPFLYMTQVLQIGVNSMLVIGLIGLFTGAVLAIAGVQLGLIVAVVQADYQSGTAVTEFQFMMLTLAIACAPAR